MPMYRSKACMLQIPSDASSGEPKSLHTVPGPNGRYGSRSPGPSLDGDLTH